MCTLMPNMMQTHLCPTKSLPSDWMICWSIVWCFCHRKYAKFADVMLIDGDFNSDQQLIQLLNDYSSSAACFPSLFLWRIHSRHSLQVSQSFVWASSVVAPVADMSRPNEGNSPMNGQGLIFRGINALVWNKNHLEIRIQRAKISMESPKRTWSDLRKN